MFDDFKSWHERDNWANLQSIAHHLEAIDKRAEEERRAHLTPEQSKAEAKAEKFVAFFVLLLCAGVLSVFVAVILWVCFS